MIKENQKIMRKDANIVEISQMEKKKVKENLNIVMERKI